MEAVWRYAANPSGSFTVRIFSSQSLFPTMVRKSTVSPSTSPAHAARAKPSLHICCNFIYGFTLRILLFVAAFQCDNHFCFSFLYKKPLSAHLYAKGAMFHRGSTLLVSFKTTLFLMITVSPTVLRPLRGGIQIFPHKTPSHHIHLSLLLPYLTLLFSVFSLFSFIITPPGDLSTVKHPVFFIFFCKVLIP